jgi:hypothetical protein
MQNDPYQTVLTPEERKQYDSWKSKLPKRLQHEGDYDLAGFWKENPKSSFSGDKVHLTDKYKKPNHPTFSDESKYFNDKTKKYAGKWEETSDAWIYMPYDNTVKRKIVELKEKQ